MQLLVLEVISTIATHGLEGALSFALIKVSGRSTSRPSVDQLGLPSAGQPASPPIGAFVRGRVDPFFKSIRTYWDAYPPAWMLLGKDGDGGGRYHFSQDSGTWAMRLSVTRDWPSGDNAMREELTSALVSGRPSCFTSKRSLPMTAQSLL